jgi:hypothetical protein
LWFSGLWNALGNSATQEESLQTAYNSSQQELEELRAATLEACEEVEEGNVQAGSSMVSRFAPSTGMFPSACAAPFTWASRRPSAWWPPMGYVVPVGVYDEVAMNCADELAAPAIDILAEDFTDFLFLDTPRQVAPKPEDHWAFVPFTLLC